MRQHTLAQRAEFQPCSKKTQREQFLEMIDAVMSWAEFFALIAPQYSKDEIGHKPVNLEIMLRDYFLQECLALSNPRVEDALYDSPALRLFGAIDLGRAQITAQR